MKIIGKNSVSQIITYVLGFIFVLVTLHLIYQVIGHSILFYRYKTGSNIFEETFILGKDIGWAKNQWTDNLNDALKYRINYPLSRKNLLSGLYEPIQIISNITFFIYSSLFFLFAFKFFREISSDKIFNANAIKWLKRFSYLNIIFSLTIFIGYLMFFQMTPFAALQFSFIALIGVLVLFIVEFFKKGYELQTENDLTI